MYMQIYTCIHVYIITHYYIILYCRHFAESVHLSSIDTWPPLQPTSPRKHDNATLWPDHRTSPCFASHQPPSEAELSYVFPLNRSARVTYAKLCKNTLRKYRKQYINSIQFPILPAELGNFQNITQSSETKSSRRAWRRSLFFKTFLLRALSSSLGTPSPEKPREAPRSTGSKLQHPTQLGVMEAHKVMWTSQGGKEHMLCTGLFMSKPVLIWRTVQNAADGRPLAGHAAWSVGYLQLRIEMSGSSPQTSHSKRYQ